MYETVGIAFGILLAGLAAIGILGLLIWSLVWVYRDAEARGKPGWAVSLLVLLLKWPISLLLWIVFRPQLLVTGNKSAGRICT
jgi:hypothetical protein